MFRLAFIGFLIAGLQVGAQPVIPRDTTYTVRSTYEKLKKSYPGIQPVVPATPKAVRQYDDVVYLTLKESPFGERQLHADVFVPERVEGKRPALLLIHGGGWRSGDKSMNTPMAQELASRGYVVVSAEYRLSLEAKYPAAVHDLKAAIRWMRAQAKKYHINPDQIAVGGASAGGQLASLIGTTPSQPFFEGQLGYPEYSTKVQAVIDMDGLLDFTAPECLALPRNSYSADVFWLQGSYDTIPDKWRQASALYWVNQTSPPFLFINSSQTRFHAGCLEMTTRLKSLGIYNEVHKLEGSPHSYWLFHPWFTPTVNLIDSFLRKTFKD